MRESERARRSGKNRLALACDSQALHAFQSCDQKYFLSKVERLVPIQTQRAYEIGTMVHDIMHRIGRAKLNRRPVTNLTLLEIGYRVIRRARKRGLLEDEDEVTFHTVKWTEFFSWMLNQEFFYKTLGVEVGFSKILYEDMDVIYAYEGRIDCITQVEPAGFRTWVDYKTQSREYSIYGNRNQFLGYSWALGANIGFILYYGLQKEKKDPFKYLSIYHHPNLIKQWREDSIKSFRHIMALIPFGSQAFERNRSSCDSGKFGNCPYTMICDNAHTSEKIQKAIRRGFYKESDWSPWK